MPFTLADRDRIVRMEEGQKALQQQVNDLKESTQRQINDLKESMQQQIADLRNLIYVVLAGMFSLFGFVLWDRRTALAPAVRSQEELKNREALIERALVEYASHEPHLADILQKLRLM